ncbi:MAG: phage regulatory CII family protein [Pseudodesulfovibrio sp.]|uniref:phage regulatory CII family protein n=1 Tax=Pseudodesulfovibrio sp. TaxID=2035812 RepID=UPI003D0CD822
MSTTTLTEIIRDMVFNSGVPTKSVAKDLGKPYTTLLRELNPDDESCKLGADLVGPIMAACGDVTPLRHLACLMGFTLCQLEGLTPDKPTLADELNDDLQAVASYHRALLDDSASVERVMELLEQAKAELEENFVIYRRERFCKAG